MVLLFSLTLMSCSYQFVEPPFEDSQLVAVTETKFGEELLSVLKDLPKNDETADIREGLGDDALVLDAVCCPANGPHIAIIEVLFEIGR